MSPEEFCEYVDAFLKAPKVLVGADQHLTWGVGRTDDCRRLKLPLAIDGEIGEPHFVLDVYPDRTPSTYHLLVVMEPAVCRFDHDPECVHQNDIFGPVAGLESTVRGPHYHSWPVNRYLLTAPSKPFKLKNAIQMPDNRNFDSTLRWFCGENNLILPPRHTIELHPRTRLI